jgi:hypothetical protein
MSTHHSTTYAQATLEYDAEHERALLDAIVQAIFATSRVSDCDAIILRTAEAAEALSTALAGVLALSPGVTRSPTALRRTVDDLGKRLRTRVAAAEKSAAVQDFVRRSFRGTDTGGMHEAAAIRSMGTRRARLRRAYCRYRRAAIR